MDIRHRVEVSEVERGELRAMLGGGEDRRQYQSDGRNPSHVRPLHHPAAPCAR